MNTVDCGVEGGIGELVDLSKLELSPKPEASGHATEEIGELAIGDTPVIRHFKHLFSLVS